MSSQPTTQHENTLRDAFRQMDGDQYQQIRDAYYKAVEGLQTLAEALELAAPPTGPSCESLIAEHLVACSAIEAINKSVLGRIL